MSQAERHFQTVQCEKCRTVATRDLPQGGYPLGDPKMSILKHFYVFKAQCSDSRSKRDAALDGHGCRWMSRARIAAVREAPSIAPGFQFSHAELFRSHRPRALESSFLFEACNFQGGLAKTVPPTFSATLLSRSTFCLDFGHRRFATYFWFSSKSPLST